MGVELGAQTYTNCDGCHQANGEGIAGVFPPLAGHLPEVVAVDGGKAYLVETLLWGLQGQIEIDGPLSIQVGRKTRVTGESVRVASEVGKGSTFTVELPVRAAG